MRTLCIGFKGQNNSSFRLVCMTTGDKLFLTNSFGGLAKDIDASKSNYDRIFLFGLNSKLRSSVRVEPCAQREGDRLYTETESSVVAQALASFGIRSYIAEKPTNYLCNAAYYHLLSKNPRAILLHIPPLRHMAEEQMRAILTALAL